MRPLLYLLSFGFIIFPQIGFAASVYFTSASQNIYAGDIFVAEARISSPDKTVNVADGSILFNRDVLEVKELSTGGSIFGLWAQNPSFFNEKGQITLIGGSPEGFKGEGGSVLKIIFLAKKEGDALLNFDDSFSLFLSDGEGTKINPAHEPFTISVLKKSAQIPAKDEWQALIQEDKNSPEFTEAIISKDPRLFDDKYFISFFAKDGGTGVLHYEVKEGEAEWTRATSPYVLRDQTLENELKIKAVDAAGNESVITPEPAPVPEISTTKYLIWIFVLIIVLAVIFVLRGKIKNKV